MSNYVLDKAYRVSAENGIEAGRAVVRGADPEECTLPAAANAAAVLGISTHGQPRNGRYIGIRRIGITRAVAAGPIAAGERVCVADAQGRVKRLELPLFTTGSAGANNALRLEWTDRASFSANMEIELEAPAEEGPFDWRFEDHKLVLTLAKDGDNITTTAAALIAAIGSDGVLSRLLRVTHGSGSNGTGLLGAATARVVNLPATMNPIGIAEDSAATEGDLVDVFLTL